MRHNALAAYEPRMAPVGNPHSALLDVGAEAAGVQRLGFVLEGAGGIGVVLAAASSLQCQRVSSELHPEKGSRGGGGQRHICNSMKGVRRLWLAFSCGIRLEPPG